MCGLAFSGNSRTLLHEDDHCKETSPSGSTVSLVSRTLLGWLLCMKCHEAFIDLCQLCRYAIDIFVLTLLVMPLSRASLRSCQRYFQVWSSAFEAIEHFLTRLASDAVESQYFWYCSYQISKMILILLIIEYHWCLSIHLNQSCELDPVSSIVSSAGKHLGERQGASGSCEPLPRCFRRHAMHQLPVELAGEKLQRHVKKCYCIYRYTYIHNII